MHMKFLGLIELIFAIVIGFHLLYSSFSRDTVMVIVGYIFARGILFTVVSKDFASIADLLFGAYILLALNGIFSHPVITIALVFWFGQKAFFSLAFGH